MVPMVITELVYPAFSVLVFILSLIFIPRRVYKYYLIYGIVLGGGGDFAVTSLMQNVFHFIQFKNQGMFYALGLNLLSPLCWTFTLMLFLYFLPERRLPYWLYLAAFSMAALFFGYMVHNANLFDFQSWFYPYLGYLSFAVWWIISGWVYHKKFLDYKD